MNVVGSYLIQPNGTIRDAMKCIDANGKGIAFVVDSEIRLLGSVSDGDLRRAILRGQNLDLSVQQLMEERQKGGSRSPITVLQGTTDSDLLHLMGKEEIRQIPIVDSAGHVLDVAFLNDIVRDYELPLTAVIMAGGFGSRLRPLTDNTPKPMLPIGDRPILERTIEQLKNVGIHRVNLTTHYKPEAISDHFGNGEDFGVSIKYVHEDQPLGTAGALSLVENTDTPLLVMNGDIVTHVDFRAMLRYHREHQAFLTVGVRHFDLQVPYGVLECDGPNILKVSEKPKLQFLVNAGLYLLEPTVREYIPVGKRFDMTDLIESLIRDGRTVVSFPIVEYWLDIGQSADYEKAKSDFGNGNLHL